MKQLRTGLSVAVTALALMASSSLAQVGLEPGKADPPEENISLKDLNASVKEMVSRFVDINIMAATTYTYSFNNPDSNFLPYLPINKYDNTISLYDGFFQVSRHREDEDFGFTFNLDIGETAQFAGADWNGDGSTEGEYIEPREFYGTYKLPWGGVKLKAGKFVSLLGYEVLMTNTAYNPTVTLSYLFMNVPYTNTGLLANIPLGEIASLDLAIVNGWDNVVDNNDSKSGMMGLGVAPLEGMTAYLAGIYGSEVCGQASTQCTALTPAGAGSKRGAVTFNMGYALPEETGLSLAVDSLYANESNVLPDAFSGNEFGSSAQWYGAAGYIMWAVPFEEVDGLAFNLRATWFGDPDGYRNPTGTSNPDVIGTPLTIWEISPTVAYSFNEHILARFEYRHDSANKLAFEKKSGYASIANTITAEVIVAF
jgi:hypothetical protein